MKLGSSRFLGSLSTVKGKERNSTSLPKFDLQIGKTGTIKCFRVPGKQVRGLFIGRYNLFSGLCGKVVKLFISLS